MSYCKIIQVSPCLYFISPLSFLPHRDRPPPLGVRYGTCYCRRWLYRRNASGIAALGGSRHNIYNKTIHYSIAGMMITVMYISCQPRSSFILSCHLPHSLFSPRIVSSFMLNTYVVLFIWCSFCCCRKVSGTRSSI